MTPKNWTIFGWKSNFCLDMPVRGVVYRVWIMPSNFSLAKGPKFAAFPEHHRTASSDLCFSTSVTKTRSLMRNRVCSGTVTTGGNGRVNHASLIINLSSIRLVCDIWILTCHLQAVMTASWPNERHLANKQDFKMPMAVTDELWCILFGKFKVPLQHSGQNVTLATSLQRLRAKVLPCAG